MTLIDIEFQPFGATSLARYGTISASVEVRSIVRPCARDHPSGLALQEIELTEPYVKDYDALPENRPVAWSARLEPGCSVVLLAHGIDGLLGGAVVTLDPAAQFALHACKDAALLWDIRVAPDRRRHAVGDHALPVHHREPSGRLYELEHLGPTEHPLQRVGRRRNRLARIQRRPRLGVVDRVPHPDRTDAEQSRTGQQHEQRQDGESAGTCDSPSLGGPAAKVSRTGQADRAPSTTRLFCPLTPRPRHL